MTTAAQPQSMVGAQPAAVRVRGEVRNPWREWVLSLVTIGIYGIIWYAKIQREMKAYDPSLEVEPVWKIFIPILNILSWVKTASLIARVQEQAGATERCSTGLGVVAGLFGFGVVYYQGQLNTAWQRG